MLALSTNQSINQSKTFLRLHSPQIGREIREYSLMLGRIRDSKEFQVSIRGSRLQYIGRRLNINLF